MPYVPKNVPAPKALLALAAATALIVLIGAVLPARAASPLDDRFVTTELPNTPAGRQMQWFIDATAQLPLSDAEIGAHFAKAFLATAGTTAQTNKFLTALFDTNGATLEGVVALRSHALVAMVTGRGGREWVVTLVVDRTGLIGFPTTITAPAHGQTVSLPRPSGPSAVGTDVLQLIDRARGGRRLMITRWYPATPAARSLPLASYASTRLRIVLGLPQVRVHAHSGARALPGRLPVVLFSPGGNTSRVEYQALAEDLASHGYLVVALDHGEAPVEFPHGRIELPAWWTNPEGAGN
jgi:hypothetical protein